MNRLDGKVAIVTGASSGIGRGIARLFAAAGAAVMVADVIEEPIEGGPPTAALIGDEGGRAEYVRTDLAEAREIERLVERTLSSHGQDDVLVNNAATYVGKALVDTTDEEWARVFAVNVTGAFLLSRGAIEAMLKQPPRDGVRGRIVNISSQHGMIAAPKDAAYGTSKAAIAQLTRQIATDYAPDGIICNAVAPGKIMTGKGGREDDPAWIERWLSRVPLGRLGAPEDVARAALFLANDDATYITGVNLMVDGGWSAS